MDASVAAPRPRPGQHVNMVVIGETDAAVVSGEIIFDRGRGIVLEAREKLDPPPKRGMKVVVVYASGPGIYSLKAAISEVLGDTRVYMIPESEPRPVEKREFIRAVVKLPAALVRTPGRKAKDMRPIDIELSASGFRWFGETGLKTGNDVRLDVALGEDGDVFSLPASVVRVGMSSEGSPEVACRFKSLDQRARDELLRVVFQARLAELGIADMELD